EVLEGGPSLFGRRGLWVWFGWRFESSNAWQRNWWGPSIAPRVQSPEFWSRALGLRGRHRLFSRRSSARTPIRASATAPSSQVADLLSWHSYSRLELSPSRCHR